MVSNIRTVQSFGATKRESAEYSRRMDYYLWVIKAKTHTHARAARTHAHTQTHTHTHTGKRALGCLCWLQPRVVLHAACCVSYVACGTLNVGMPTR